MLERAQQAAEAAKLAGPPVEERWAPSPLARACSVAAHGAGIDLIRSQRAQFLEKRLQNPNAPARRSPVKEIVYGVRAICPLIGALVLLVVVVLRQPLPKTDFMVEEGEAGGAAAADEERPEVGFFGGGRGWWRPAFDV